MNNLVLVLRSGGQIDKALALARGLLERRRVSLGPAHEQTLHAQMVVGGILAQERRFDEAEAPLLAAIEGFRATSTSLRRPRIYPDHPNTLVLLANASLYFANEGAHVRAAALCDQAVATCERIRPGEPALGAELLRRMGVYRLQAGDAQGAYESLHSAFELCTIMQPRDAGLIAAVRGGSRRTCRCVRCAGTRR